MTPQKTLIATKNQGVTQYNSQKALQLYSPANCFKSSSKLRTVADAIRLKSVTLGQLRQEFGRDWILGYIEIWLIDLNEFLGVKNGLDPAQIKFTSERIYDTYSLKITDITLFFRQIKEGAYGPIYENLSPDKILSWLQKYYDLRCETAEMYASVQHEKISLTKDKIHPKVIEKMFKGVGDEVVDFEELEGVGVGSRFKNVVVADLPKKIKSMTTKELRKYLVDSNVQSPTYDELVYKLIEAEIDSRL